MGGKIIAAMTPVWVEGEPDVLRTKKSKDDSQSTPEITIGPWREDPPISTNSLVFFIKLTYDYDSVCYMSLICGLFKH